MKSIIALFVLALTASTVLGCQDHHGWALAYGLYIDSGTAADASAATKCPGIIDDGNSCCDVAVVNNFQNKADEIVEYLEGLAGDRDQIILLRRDYIATRRGSLESIRDASDRLSRVSSSNATLQQLVDYAQEEYGKFATQLTSDWAELVSNFTEYQKARSTCANILLTTQAGAWCTVCRDSFTTFPGFTSSGLTYSAQYKAKLLSTCYPYLEHSALQSNILVAYYYRNYLDQLADSMNRLADGNSIDFERVDKAVQATFVPEHEVTGPGRYPEECPSKTNCPWFFAVMFENAILSNSTFIRGSAPLRSAVYTPVNNNFRVLPEEEGRNLQTTWEPITGEIDIAFAFSENPASWVNTENSAMRSGVVACVITLVASLFF